MLISFLIEAHSHMIDHWRAYYEFLGKNLELYLIVYELEIVERGLDPCEVEHFSHPCFDHVKPKKIKPEEFVSLCKLVISLEEKMNVNIAEILISHVNFDLVEEVFGSKSFSDLQELDDDEIDFILEFYQEEISSKKIYGENISLVNTKKIHKVVDKLIRLTCPLVITFDQTKCLYGSSGLSSYATKNAYFLRFRLNLKLKLDYKKEHIFSEL